MQLSQLLRLLFFFCAFLYSFSKQKHPDQFVSKASRCIQVDTGNDDDDGDSLASTNSEHTKKRQDTATSTYNGTQESTEEDPRAQSQEVTTERDASQTLDDPVLLLRQRRATQMEEDEQFFSQLYTANEELVTKLGEVQTANKELETANHGLEMTLRGMQSSEMERESEHEAAYHKLNAENQNLVDENHRLARQVVEIPDHIQDCTKLSIAHMAEKFGWEVNKKELEEKHEADRTAWAAHRSWQANKISELEVALEKQSTKMKDLQRGHEINKSSLAIKSGLVEQAEARNNEHSLLIKQAEAQIEAKHRLESQIETILKDLQSDKNSFIDAHATDRNTRRVVTNEYLASLQQQRDEAREGQRHAEDEAQKTRRTLFEIILQCCRLGIPLDIPMPVEGHEQGEATRSGDQQR